MGISSSAEKDANRVMRRGTWKRASGVWRPSGVDRKGEV